MINQAHRFAAAGSRILVAVHPRTCLYSRKACSAAKGAGKLETEVTALGEFPMLSVSVDAWRKFADQVKDRQAGAPSDGGDVLACPGAPPRRS